MSQLKLADGKSVPSWPNDPELSKHDGFKRKKGERLIQPVASTATTNRHFPSKLCCYGLELSLVETIEYWPEALKVGSFGISIMRGLTRHGLPLCRTEMLACWVSQPLDGSPPFRPH